MAPTPNSRLNSLAAIEAQIWQQLLQCRHVKDHAWRTPVLATVNGDRADARTIVLREVDARDKLLSFYTDERAGKVVQLLRNPRATLVMWSPALSWQLRCQVRLILDMTGLSASSPWASLRLTSAANDYLGLLPPGTVLATPEAPPAATPPGTRATDASPDTEANPDAADGEPAPPGRPRAYFSAISAEVQSIDWLELHADGHRRAVFDAAGARWVQP